MRMGVVLCTYNGERYVREQVESIIHAQTRLPDAVVVQDDGSTDQTVAILESCAVQAPFSFDIVRNAENLGFVGNFERAILRCRADIIVLSDQDDRWDPDKLRKIENTFASDPRISAVFSDAEIVDQTLTSLGYGLLHALNVTDTELRLVRDGQIFPVLLRRNIAAGATLAFKASWKERLLPIPEAAFHDEWIALLTAAFNELRFIPEPLIQYRQHTANQIGGRRWNFAQRFHSLLGPRRAEELRILKMMRSLYERLSRLEAPPTVLAEVQGKSDHLRLRTSLPSRRLLRAPSVIQELMTGRYARYSSGWRAAVRDLVSPV